MANIFQIEYPKIIFKILENISHGKIVRIPQDNIIATYFPKRVPEDGLLDWNWQKERIYNWVRAQSNPYPGAFTYYKNSKVIIHKIEFSEIGFNFKHENGTILQGGNQPIIKTANGAVKLLVIETDKMIEFIKDEILHERH